MSFQTQILFRYVYEWSKFFSVIISDLFFYYLNVSLRWASCFISQPFFQEIMLLNLAQNWVELNVRDRIICKRLWKQPADWQVLCLRDWNSFSCFVIFLSRVLLPTLNVDVNPKKPAKPADLKMSAEVILRSPEGAGRGALSFLSRGAQRNPSPEWAGRGAVSSSGWRYARNREAA